MSVEDTITALEGMAATTLELLEKREAGRPLVIEFSGSPKAGKTTAIQVLSLFLRRNGIRVSNLIERASVSPVRVKGHLHNNVWVSCASLQGLLESVYRSEEHHIFILDRGIFDGLVWNTWLHLAGRISTDESRRFADFFLMSRWTDLIDLVCVMTCEPEVSLDREFAGQLTHKGGRVMDSIVLGQINASINTAISEYGSNFKQLIKIDTTHMATLEGVVNLTRATLNALNTFLDPLLCVVPKHLWDCDLPANRFIDDKDIACRFIETVETHKCFVRRSEGERNSEYLIPIPCALIRYRDQILFLRRNEPGHPLHDTYAIWAGGHVSDIDDHGDSVVIEGLKRELAEEVFIKDGYTLEPIGLVRTSSDDRAARHIGIVYEARLSTSDVSLALDQKEFRETRGLSMSGRLVEIGRVREYYRDMGDWSRYIIDRYWPDQGSLFPK